MKNPNEPNDKLTRTEIARANRFAEKKEALLAQGYTYEEITANIVFANIMAFVYALPYTLLFGFLFLRSYGLRYDPSYNLNFLILVVLFFLCVVLHECIHALFFGMFAEHHYRDIEFGVLWKYLTPYCYCAAPLKRWQYVVGALMPTVVLGLGMGIVALLLGSGWMLLLSIFLFVGGGGDILIVTMLLHYSVRNRDVIFMDHPTECGLCAFWKAVD